MRRTWTGTAAAAALATAFVIPAAVAQETQQGKQAPAGAESGGQHRETGQGQMRERAGQPAAQVQPGAQAQTEQPRTGAEPPQGQNSREPGQAGRREKKGESAQTQEPGNRMQPGNKQAQERRGQAEDTGRPKQPGRTADQNRMGQAQNHQNAQAGQSGQNAQAGQSGTTGRNVQTQGRANLPQDKAAQVAQTLGGSGNVQSAPNIDVNQVSIGANLPGEVIINPLPPTIVELVPEFRGYDYFVIGDEVVIVDPATRQVVEIIEDVG